MDMGSVLQFVWPGLPSFGIRTPGGSRGCTEGNRGGRVIVVMVKVVLLVEEEKEEDDELSLGHTKFKPPKRH